MSETSGTNDFPTGAGTVLSATGPAADADPTETREWLDAIDAIVRTQGKERAQFLFDRLADHVVGRGVQSKRARVTPYRNTIPVEHESPYPGDLKIEERLMARRERWGMSYVVFSGPVADAMAPVVARMAGR